MIYLDARYGEREWLDGAGCESHETSKFNILNLTDALRKQ